MQQVSLQSMQHFCTITIIQPFAWVNEAQLFTIFLKPKVLRSMQWTAHWQNKLKIWGHTRIEFCTGRTKICRQANLWRTTSIFVLYTTFWVCLASVTAQYARVRLWFHTCDCTHQRRWLQSEVTRREPFDQKHQVNADFRLAVRLI